DILREIARMRLNLDILREIARMRLNLDILREIARMRLNLALLSDELLNVHLCRFCCHVIYKCVLMGWHEIRGDEDDKVEDAHGQKIKQGTIAAGGGGGIYRYPSLPVPAAKHVQLMLKKILNFFPYGRYIGVVVIAVGPHGHVIMLESYEDLDFFVANLRIGP
ncbi:hypothetical protein ACJX0J_034098, partial [Zea mays]